MGVVRHGVEHSFSDPRIEGSGARRLSVLPLPDAPVRRIVATTAAADEGSQLDEIRLLTNCQVGLGFSYQGFQAGLGMEPHAIGCDAGSSDFGPYYLGLGIIQKSPVAVKRDLQIMLQGARRLGVPLLIGSCGGAGANPHLAAYVDILREIAVEQSLHFRLATIEAQIPPAALREKLAAGQLRSMDGAPEIDAATVDRLSAAVGMMGAEPFQRALEMGADVVLAGRSTDPAITVAVPLLAGLPVGPSWHASKTIDKGYLATTTPTDGSPVLATIRADHFTVAPMREGSRCSVASVASMTLHENPNPFLVAQPSGTIDTTDAVYEQLDERTVRVTGSRFNPAPGLTIKVEGAERVGYRTLLIAGIRDPRVLERIDEFLDAYRKALGRTIHSMGIEPSEYVIQFRVYGRDAVLGDMEPLRTHPIHEAGLLIDVVGRTEEISGAIGTKLGGTGSRLDISGRLGGGGNFAYPFSPSLIKVGPAFEWSIWHLMDTDARELETLFPVRMQDV